MITITLKRTPSTDDGTFGSIILPDGKTIRTAELPWKNNKNNVSCIPTGTYLIKNRKATTKFKYDHYHVLETNGSEVNGRDTVLIHIGNWAGDISKGKKSDVEGCILVGMTTTKDDKGQRMLSGSKDAFILLRKELGIDDFTLIIE